MPNDDILARVRRAMHIADGLKQQDATFAEQLLRSWELCRQTHSEFLRLLEQAHPVTGPGREAQAKLLADAPLLQQRDILLQRVLEGEGEPQAEIHTETPRNQLQ